MGQRQNRRGPSFAVAESRRSECGPRPAREAITIDKRLAATCCHSVALVEGCCSMDDDAAKANLHNYLKHEREAVLAKLDGLSEYDVRRPLTVTGTNLLGLVKHLATWEARYLGEVFDRPFPEPLRPLGRQSRGDSPLTWASGLATRCCDASGVRSTLGRRANRRVHCSSSTWRYSPSGTRPPVQSLSGPSGKVVVASARSVATGCLRAVSTVVMASRS